MVVFNETALEVLLDITVITPDLQDVGRTTAELALEKTRTD